MDLPELDRARTAEESGGGGGGRTYKRDEGGQFSTSDTNDGPGGRGSKPTQHPTTKPNAKPTYKPITPVKSHKGPMKVGGDNDPQQVKQLQALLGVLGLGTPPTNGQFDQATADAVMEAQRRLGLKPNGRASTALLNKLISAHALSPCVQRSTTNHEFDILRAAVQRGDFDEDHVLDNGICRTCEED